MRLLTTLFLVFLGLNVWSTTHLVTSTNDSGTGSIRAAIALCATTGDTVRLSPSLIASGSDTIHLQSELYFTKSIVFKGVYNTTDTLYLSGADSVRVMYADYASFLELDSMVIVNGSASLRAGGLTIMGGAQAIIKNSVFSNNSANGHSSTIYFFPSSSVVPTFYMTNSKVQGGSAYNNGGIEVLADTITITSTQFYNNNANGYGAGAADLLSEGVVIVDSCEFMNNSSLQGKGALKISSYNSNTIETVILSDVLVENNVGDEFGGVLIRNCERFKLENSDFIGNLATDTLSSSGNYRSGGLSFDTDVADSIVIKNSLFESNGSYTGGLGARLNLTGLKAGVDSVYVLLEDLTVSGNYKYGSSGNNMTGGALSVSVWEGYSLVIKNCTIQNNNLNKMFSGGLDVYALAAGNLDVTGCTITQNTGAYRGGGISLDVDTLTGVISNNLLSENSSTNQGGGMRIYAYPGSLGLVVDSCEFRNNTSGTSGGAGLSVFAKDSTQLIVQNSKFENNTATGMGGGIAFLASYDLLTPWNVECVNLQVNGNAADEGAGIAFIGASSNFSAEISNSTISNNLTNSIGGAVLIDGTEAKHFLISHSTISGNQAYKGAAIFDSSFVNWANPFMPASVEIVNSTVVNNTSVIGAAFASKDANGGIQLDTVISSLFFGNLPTTFASTNVTFASGGYNIFEATTVTGSVTSDQLNVDSTSLNIGPLQLNGGVTKTHMPIAPSVAIDAGNPVDLTSAQNTPIQGTREVGAAEFCAGSISNQWLTVCDSLLWINNVVYYSNAIDTAVFVNQAGCDSLIILNLVVLSDTVFVDSLEACDAYTWANGTTYTSSVAVTDTFSSVLGCDSIVTLALTINNSATAIDTIVACNNYTWIDGNNYASNNTTATHTLTTVNGCDSVVTLNLTIINSTFATDTIVACDSYTWINGQTYTANNSSAVHLLTNVAGCDSVVTLNLTMLQSSSSTDSIVACNSYTWVDGNTYNTSNYLATHTYTNSVGCDSIVTLHLDLGHDTTYVNTVTTCDSYTWMGVTYTNSITVADTFASVLGCDSIHLLDLTINHSSTAVDTIVACDSYTWLNGITYTTGNTSATHTLTNTVGCDSVVTLHLTLLQSSSSTHTVTACNSYTWMGTTYTSSNNSATYTFPNAVGCDSVITLDLTINHDQTAVDSIVACNSYTWINGVTYTSSNTTATHQLTSAAGCDSTVTLHLTIATNASTTDNISACSSYTWANGQTYLSSQSVVDTFQTMFGCDSVVTLQLTILQPTAFVDVISACDSYTWIDGVTYTSNNTTASHTLINSVGCDSVITLDLTILNTTYGTHVVSACDSYVWQGITYTASNSSATHTYTNSVGCDSIVTLDLTILNSTTGTDQILACNSYTWIDGNTYTNSNNSATHVLTNSVGCDSTVTLDLTIVNDVAVTDVVSVCNSYLWNNGQTYTSSQTVVDTFQTIHGCDSVVTLQLTILQPSVFTDVVSACDNYTWIDGNTYTNSNNSATHVLTNAVGCDSVITLNLTILNSSSAIDMITSCGAYTWIDGITYTSNNNTATHVVPNAMGCDSVITLDLTINTVDTAVVQTGLMLEAQAAAATFQWIDCANNQAIADSINAQFTASVSGSYAVAVSQNGCVDTSSCYTLTNVGINTLNANFGVQVYPNPSSQNFNVALQGYESSTQLQIISVLGKVVYQQMVLDPQANVQINIPTSGWAKGQYILKLTSGNSVKTTKLILQ